jgi:hypothetical protein
MSAWIVDYREITTDRTAHWKRHVLIHHVEHRTRYIDRAEIVLAWGGSDTVILPRAEGAGPCGTAARDKPHCRLVDGGDSSAMSSWVSLMCRGRPRKER